MQDVQDCKYRSQPRGVVHLDAQRQPEAQQHPVEPATPIAAPDDEEQHEQRHRNRLHVRDPASAEVDVPLSDCHEHGCDERESRAEQALPQEIREEH